MFAIIILFVQTIATSSDWVAFDRDTVCEAVARSLLMPRKGEPQPHVTLSFDRVNGRKGELSVALRRPVRPGSTVVLTIGDQPFLLSARGDRGWSRGPAQEQAIIAAMRSAGGMRVEARDASGRRTVDRYTLSGAPTAIDAAAAACLKKR
ncbi:MAG: hypothetical protein V4696_02590 [Pseudomonadota bacterium]